MSYAIFSAMGAAACWKWGDWRNWRLYYPTILYACIGNLVYDVLTYNRALWAFGSTVYHYPFLDLAIMALLYPSTVILFLTHFPGQTGRKILYVALWTFLYTLIEAAAWLTKGFIYFNGWNTLYSLGFNAVMFPLFRLHFKRPLLAWPISAAMAFCVVWWFRIPLLR